MKQIIKNIVVLILVAGLPVFFVSCSNKAGGGHSGHGAEKAAQKYTCPMHPNYISDKPGECPICGMDLVPVADEEPAGEPVEGLAPVTIPDDKQKLIGVKTSVAEIKDVARVIRAAGRIAYDPELYTAQQEYISSLKTYERARGSPGGVSENAKSLLAASRMRLKLLGLGDEQIDNLSKRDSPDGTLLLAKDGRAWVYASVYEDDLKYVAAAQPVTISAPSMLSEKISGEIVSVDTVLDAATRSAKVRIRAHRVPEEMKPETYVSVEIAVPMGSSLVVPQDAVIDTGTRQVVFIAREEGVFEPREVKAVYASDGYYALQSGLEEGERVVTNANFLVDSESQLKASMQKAGGAGEHKH